MKSFLTQSAKQLMKDLKLANVHEVPRITSVVVMVGVGKQRDNAGYTKAVVRDIEAITGQKPHERRAKQAVAGFNVRQGNLVAYRVTLRGKRMNDFVQRLITVTLPRVRDFRGVPLYSLDGHGNLSVGLTEQLPFPEIQADKTDVIFGVQVTMVTTARTNAEGEALFRSIGFPFTTEIKRTKETLKKKVRIKK